MPIEDFSRFRIETAVSDDGWTVKFFLPYDYLRAHFGAVTPVWRCNFYKCGDKTAHPHYGAWKEVETDAPDFHQRAFFGDLLIEGGLTE